MDNNSSCWLEISSLDLNAKPLLQRLDHPLPAAALPSASLLEQRRSQSADLEEEVERVRAENRKLTEMLTAMCESYNGLRRQLMDHLNKNNNVDVVSNSEDPGKRKYDEMNNNNNLALGVSESSTTEEDSAAKKQQDHHPIRAKVSTVCVRTQLSDNSTTLVVKDGYQWRKYGQKVTRDNPCPRAYFKCSFAPTCPVKKKVQRSAEDQSMVVATYEGDHNHPPPSTSHMEGQGPSSPVTQTRSNNIQVEASGKRARVESPQARQHLVQQMASSLTTDPNFTAALAAAISAKIFPDTN